MLDEQKFEEQFEDLMTRAYERTLKADGDDLKEATDIYLDFVDRYDKVQKTTNQHLADEGKLVLEVEKKDADIELRKKTLELEIDHRISYYRLEKQKERVKWVTDGVKIALTALTIGVAFMFDNEGRIFTSTAGKRLISTVVSKPGDNLKI